MRSLAMRREEDGPELRLAARKAQGGRGARRSYWAGTLLGAVLALRGYGQTATGAGPDPSKLSINLFDPSAATESSLTNLSLEDLMNIEVTSVSRQKQRIGDAAAAVHVITQEEIHRSGMNALPELLRLAPGMDVAQLNSGAWAVGARGLNQARTNNLLVLMDGRTVYTPLFAGVYWDMVDYVLDDLDRIEVVRGPGGTLWGANAVNGVINIISKSAEETQGGLVQGYAGSDGYIGSVRYGGNFDNRVFYRVYTKYRTMDDMPDAANPRAIDGWDSHREGFRIDAHLSDADLLTVQGDNFMNRAGHPRDHISLAPPFVDEHSDISDTNGGNFLARYTHTFSENSDVSVQMYYDTFHLTDHFNTFDQGTYDLEFQHRFRLAQIHEIIWGGGYRLVTDKIRPTGTVIAEGDYADPNARNNSLVNGFVQDDIALVPQRLHAVVGTKLEMVPYTGFEFQPTARLIFTPDAKNTIWGAVSRAVRSPSRFEEDSHVLGSAMAGDPLPVGITFAGNRSLKSEQLLVVEGGYRTEPVSSVSLDMSTFLNFHHGLVETLPVGDPVFVPGPVPHIDAPTRPLNAAEGVSYGAELAAQWKASDQLRLSASYSFLQMDVHTVIPGNDGGRSAALNGSAPAHQAQVRAYYDITKDLQVNAATWFVGTLEDPHVGSYFRTDLNVVWKPERHIELMAGVRNLFDPQHPEFLDQDVRSTANEVPRTFYFMFTAKF
jgi:iron complex outermembrane receptor protein